MKVICDQRQLINILGLNREANTGTIHENIKNFIKRTRRIHSNIRTIVSRNILALESFTSSHQATHRWHDFKVKHSIFKLLTLFFGYRITSGLLDMFIKEVKITSNCFIPVLSTIFFPQPLSIAALINELLIESG